MEDLRGFAAGLAFTLGVVSTYLCAVALIVWLVVTLSGYPLP